MSTMPSVVLNVQIPNFQRIPFLAPQIIAITPTNVNADIGPKIEITARNILVVMTVTDVVERDDLGKIPVVLYHLLVLVHTLVLLDLSLAPVAQDLALVVLASTPTLPEHPYMFWLQTISPLTEPALILY